LTVSRYADEINNTILEQFLGAIALHPPTLHKRVLRSKNTVVLIFESKHELFYIKV